ncbi:6283_t:CDS:1 [Gigaspora margarita]|uniref:6283_t:CDS:1 n=1 Tax=Gigaspora margarita TaxID=4874 RepID=A0ABN7VWX2_GIGMA|nr:6283_t:CDS:1 [Gigaspora margarita]
MSTTLMGILGMLRHNLQQKLYRTLKEKPKEQTLSTLSTNLTNVENSNNNLLFEKEGFEEELLEFDIKAVTIDMNDKLIIEEFFNIEVFEQNQNISDESSNTYLQNAMVSTEDWSIDKIFFQSEV